MDHPTLRIACVQMFLAWQDEQKNLHTMKQYLTQAASQGIELIVFPETVTTGFTVSPSELASLTSSQPTDQIAQWSRQYNIAIATTLLVREGEKIFNRFFFFTPQGDIYTQDKRHLFRMGGEHKALASASRRITIEYLGWNIFPAICYDLRFPVWCRNRNLEYDLMLVPANWPQSRAQVWQTLLRARAIENLSYVCGVNRVGEDPYKIVYQGDTQIISFRGEVIASAQTHTAELITAELSQEKLRQFREKFATWRDADSFSIDF